MSAVLTKHHCEHDNCRHCLRCLSVHDSGAYEQAKALSHQGDEHSGKPIAEEGSWRQPQASLHAPAHVSQEFVIWLTHPTGLPPFSSVVSRMSVT